MAAGVDKSELLEKRTRAEVEGYCRWLEGEIGDMRWLCDALMEVYNELIDRCDCEAANMDAGQVPTSIYYSAGWGKPYLGYRAFWMMIDEGRLDE